MKNSSGPDRMTVVERYSLTTHFLVGLRGRKEKGGIVLVVQDDRASFIEDKCNDRT